MTRVLNQQEYIVQTMQRVLLEFGIELEEDLQTTDQQYRVLSTSQKFASTTSGFD